MAAQMAERAREALGCGGLTVSISGTYHMLRAILVLLALVLPIHLVVLGWLFWDVPVQDSLSAYYHAKDGELRDWFVGYLCVVGLLLVVYRGFTPAETWALSLAGLCLVVVAMIPTGTSKLHGVAAIGFFALISYVAVFRARDTLSPSLIKSPKRLKAYRVLYPALSIAMILLVAATVGVWYAVDPSKLTLVLEWAGVWAFGAYWLVKSVELAGSGAEAKAVKAQLVRSEPSSKLGKIFGPVRVEQIEVGRTE